MHFEPLPQHKWLQKLLGDWTSESTCNMGPDQPPQHMVGTETVTGLGEAWVVGEWKIDGPDGKPMPSVITLGYDPVKQKFVGTFVSSMMSHLWIYEGELDAAEKVLTLNATGPCFSGTGTTDYQDIIEIIDENYRTLSSQMKQADGTWVRFMTCTVRRKA